MTIKISKEARAAAAAFVEDDGEFFSDPKDRREWIESCLAGNEDTECLVQHMQRLIDATLERAAAIADDYCDNAGGSNSYKTACSHISSSVRLLKGVQI